MKRTFAHPRPPRGVLVQRRALARILAWFTEKLGGETLIEGMQRITHSADTRLIHLLRAPQGATGPAGADATGPAPKGPTGFKGPTGAAGLEIPGSKGPKGATGPAGNDSTDPTKTALVATRDHGIVAMHAMESPQAWFKDHVSIPVIAGHAAAFVDADFQQCCAPGSLIALAAFIPGYGGRIGAEILPGARPLIRARCQPAPPDGTLLTLTIAGIHRDHSKRLPLCPREQYERNRDFYRAAHGVTHLSF